MAEQHIQSGKCSRALDTWNALQGVLQRVPSPTGTLQPRKAADRRAIERSRDRLAKALDACSEAGLQRPQGGIARSLRLPNVLLALYRLLSALAHRYRDCGHLLTDNLYLRVFLRNVDSKSRELVRLLTHERGAVLEERSPARRQLTRLSLVLSHIATELSAFFPHGVYEGESVEIRERDAAAFWTHAFDDRVIVPWKEFLEQISQCHQLDSKHEVIALQESMDLTCSGWVSVYDFDIFTRLFQPWSFALQSWKALMLSHPGYMAFLTYDEVRTRLQKYQSKPGSYVFRLSCSRPGQWAIGYVAKDGRIVQAVPPPTMPLHEVLQDGAKQGLYLYPDGRCKNVDLSSLCQHTRSSTSSPDEPNRSPIPQICREYFFVPMADGEKLSPGRQGSTAVSDDLMSLFDPLSPSSLQPTNANELLTPPIPPRSPTSRYTPLVAAEHSTVDTEIERLLGKGFTYTAIARAFRVANGDPQLAETILKAYAQPSLSTMLSTCQP